MYIVSRTFRDANGVFKVGSVVEPTDVKAFKSRLQQRHIINVDEQNIDKWAQYFMNRYGIDLLEVLNETAYDDSNSNVEVSITNEEVTQDSSTVEDDKDQATNAATENDTDNSAVSSSIDAW